MSDDGKAATKTGYKLEYSSTARAMCKGPKPCNGTKLEKGTLRLGVVSDFRGHPTTSYRHYGCITKKVWQNIKAAYPSVEDVEGYDALTEDDKTKVRAAWEAEAVAPEDVPASAIANADEEEAGGSKKKAAGRPRKKQKVDHDDDSDEPKPKKKAAPRRKKKADSDDDADVSPSDDGGSDYGGGKKRKRPSKKSPKKKAAEDDDY
ncbi:hypothetical protein M408DRAFT_326744 [Serendipita vermifera MAFF 305830]|uniref:PARP-type domain-containing protein n=1 Tax=Serendipita vermifera MAFF 305830 TaxID=933852 RepID=A0A0C3BM46_SERVB|nr:hypothetical protein M408DRAFT_326744 [Serendipita vermifera MAFF 305830]